MAQRFEDLIFRGSPEGVFRSSTVIGDYTLSVIKEPHKALYEAAVFEGNDFVQLPGIHRTPEHDEDTVDDVIPYLTTEQVSGIMLKLHTLAGVPVD